MQEVSHRFLLWTILTNQTHDLHFLWTCLVFLNGLIDLCVACCLISCWNIFHWHRDVTFAIKRWEKNLDLCFSLMVYEQWAIFNAPYLLWQEALVFVTISMWSLHFSSFIQKSKSTEDLFFPSSSGGWIFWKEVIPQEQGIVWWSIKKKHDFTMLLCHN